MKSINYIKHLNFWFELCKDNPSIKPTHISIYMALFQLWNNSRFADYFIITRSELMNLSRIGSKSTYCNCLKDLDEWGWIVYRPSQSRYGQSQVKMICTEILMASNKKKMTIKCPTTSPYSGTLEGVSTGPTSGTTTGLVVGHLYKDINNKQKQLNINNSKISKYDEQL